MPAKRTGRPRRTAPRWTTVQQKLLKVLEQPEHRRKSLAEICQLAGYGEWAWERAVKDHRFVSALQPYKLRFLDPPRGRPAFEHHLNVTLADHPEEELAKDVWDMRRLLPEYPRHRQPDGITRRFYLPAQSPGARTGQTVFPLAAAPLESRHLSLDPHGLTSSPAVLAARGGSGDPDPRAGGGDAGIAGTVLAQHGAKGPVRSAYDA